MEGYPSRPRVVNLGCAPAVPELVWSFERRRAMSLDRCRGKQRPRGRARRHRREVTTKQHLAFIEALRAGQAVIANPDGATYSWRAVIEGRRADSPPWLETMRRQARQLLQLAIAHGPASGWGIPQPQPEGAPSRTWTPYYVPKAGERCWRWWRALVLGLARLLTRMARALRVLVPLHRAPQDVATPEETRSSSASETAQQYRGAGTSGDEWRAAAERVAARIAAM